ncbi:hypothetical protein psal_cds_1037 [Pandoravirus salinus]|uniref:Uncharacterized protein n=1 Tax=Pandoravirus salinus TaxID=1349410 RepID=S4VX30_9VIRU|nr:hypothetical protein psal_cds_1037 [Pandoravirus salinus]AGO85229.1 hypothetical protein psal_cds_1037 [Pandoravirus salinus]
MYHVRVRNYNCPKECKDHDAVDEFMTVDRIIEWMFDTDMEAVCDGVTCMFLVSIYDDRPPQKAFVAAAGRALCDAKVTDDVEATLKACARATGDTRLRLVDAYDQHMGARRWIDRVVSWCAEHPGREFDMAGNQSLVGVIKKCPSSIA